MMLCVVDDGGGGDATYTCLYGILDMDSLRTGKVRYGSGSTIRGTFSVLRFCGSIPWSFVFITYQQSSKHHE